jgi:hypothetical protein
LQQRLSDVWVFPWCELRALFNDRYLSAKPSHGLRKLEADKSTAEHDHALWNPV